MLRQKTQDGREEGQSQDKTRQDKTRQDKTIPNNPEKDLKICNRKISLKLIDDENRAGFYGG